MANITKTLTVDKITYKDLLGQNVKVYQFNTEKNTFSCIGVSNINENELLEITVPSDGTYFVAPLNAPIYDKNNMTNVWKDNFDYTGLPKNGLFTYDTGNNNGWGNNELEYYQSNNSDNVNVNNGVLNLVAQYDATGITDSTGTYNYTSARLKSVDSWLYGRFEVTAKLPSASAGSWPAIWFLPKIEEFGAWPASGEIDIMEMMNNNQDLIHGSLHSTDQNFKVTGYHNTATIIIPNTDTTYNTYGCTWTPEFIEFDINGIKYFKCEKDLSKVYDPKSFPWTTPFYLLLNIAVGGSAGGTVVFNKDTNRFDIDLKNAGDSNWRVQFYGFNMVLKENTDYYYTIKFNSTIARKISIGIQNSNSNTPYFLNDYDVNQGENTITGKYTATSTDENDKFILFLGGESATTLAEHIISIEDIEVSTTVIDNLTPIKANYTNFIKTALNNNGYTGIFAPIDIQQ